MTSKAYRIVGVLLGAAALILAFVGPVASGVRHATIAGVATFAVLYVIAQAVERIVEFVVALLNLLPDSPGERKEEGLRKIGTARSTMNGNPALADFVTDAAANNATAAKEVVEARKDVAFVGLGLSALLAVIAVNALNYGLLRSIGTTGVDGDIDRLLTALAAAGGSTALHELVGRLKKAKEGAEVAASSG